MLKEARSKKATAAAAEGEGQFSMKSVAEVIGALPARRVEGLQQQPWKRIG